MTATAPNRPTARVAARGTRQPAFINGGANGSRRAEALHRPRRGEPRPAVKRGTRWTTIGFMAAIHVLAVVALLPRFWSVPAVASLLVLYWVTHTKLNLFSSINPSFLPR